MIHHVSSERRLKALIVLVYFMFVITVVAAAAVILDFAIGEPPRHCRYLVPIQTVPGSYACSEYSRPVTKP